MSALLESKIDLPLFVKGKVRDVYDLGEKLLIVSSDRISAYDFVLPNLIPDKGKILNQLSVFWFRQTAAIVKNHLITADTDEYPTELSPYKNLLEKRSMLVWKTEKIPIECVVRGHISGSGWEEYSRTGKVCGISLPQGLKESQKIPDPIFTPATKETGGNHDQNITFDEMSKKIGRELSINLKKISFSLFEFAYELLKKKGLILADTKLEFGLKESSTGKQEIILIDECFTPDSSRLWEKEQFREGSSPLSIDKQFVRNYLDSIGWNRQPPVPSLPQAVVEQTRMKYQEALKRIIG